MAPDVHVKYIIYEVGGISNRKQAMGNASLYSCFLYFTRSTINIFATDSNVDGVILCGKRYRHRNHHLRRLYARDIK